MTVPDVTMASTDLDLVPDGVLKVDADRRITDANRAARRMLGLTDDLPRAPLEEVLDPRTRDGHRILVGGWHPSVRLRGVRAIPEQDLLVRRMDDSDVRVFVTGRFERDGDGRLIGAVLSLREAARRTRLQVGGIEIVSTVSHELRSPLTSVKGYTSMLLNKWERLNDEQKQMMLTQINHDADRVTRMITELLDVSRLETGRLVLRREQVDLPVLAASVVEKVGMAYDELDCSVTFPDGFPRVFADPHKVEQVLTNLVENAAKYGCPTGMAIVGSQGTDEVVVSVIDKGEGIPRKDLGRVFNKFFRRDEGRPTGTGLGLFISQGLVEAHGGELTVSSVVGEGTTFSFSLPTTALEELLAELDA